MDVIRWSLEFRILQIIVIIIIISSSSSGISSSTK